MPDPQVHDICLNIPGSEYTGGGASSGLSPLYFHGNKNEAYSVGTQALQSAPFQNLFLYKTRHKAKTRLNMINAT